MTWLSLLGGRRALASAAAILLVAVACAVPAYHFVEETFEHCGNHVPDPESGESDSDCGGSDCPGCSLGRHCNTSVDCAEGHCLGGFCQEPGCENDTIDGDETATDCGGDCGGCRDGLACKVSTDCLSRVCGPDDLCSVPTCTDTVRNGDELDTDCGGSCDGCGIGSPCTEAIGCESRLCDSTTLTCALNCTRDRDECDGNEDEPCETNLLTSADNCGACGTVCRLAHADALCSGGNCQIDECVAPYLRCNTDDSDGCEVNGSTDVENCGACGTVCTDLHGDPSCVNSKCVIECDRGFGDCDEDPLTGCETSVGDVENCGACGKRCPADEGEPFCVDDECGQSDCDDGQGDCDGDHVCETDLDDDLDNCGRCGHICSAANGKVACVAGRCVISECSNGWQNCDEEDEDRGLANGCETNVASDTKNCGRCGQRCDTVAHGSGTCQEGSCALECDTPYEDCDRQLQNGCEVDTTSDPQHCGGCLSACSIPNATPACSNSGCMIDECTENYANCNGADGCETDVSSSIQHCGSCMGTCSSAGAVEVSCSNARCDAPTCDANHLSCDDDNDNGCETDVTTTTNCGACGKSCAGTTPNCVQSGSTYQCQAKITLATNGPYPTATAAAGSLSFNVTPRAGSNRLALVVVVSDSLTSNAVGAGIAGARPGSVNFGNQSMTAGPSQVGVNESWSPDLFVYYLPLGDSASDGPQVAVSIGGSSGPANVVVAQSLQLNGVRQAAPVTGSVGGYLGAPDPDDPGVVAPSLPVDVSGSLIYSFLSDYWDTRTCAVGTTSSSCPAWSVTPAANLTATETMATAPLTFYPPNSGSAPMRAFGMVVTAASPALPAAGTYKPTWSDPNPGRLTHLAIAIAPAQAP